MDPRDRNKRQLAQETKRKDGDRSARIALDLMKLPDSAIPKLDLPEELRAEVEAARRITSMVARRRAERALAGSLRSEDMKGVSERIERWKETGAGETKHLHLAELWRTKLLEGGMEAAAELPALAEDTELPQLLLRARAERDTGKPPGAGRVLFRRIASILKPPPASSS